MIHNPFYVVTMFEEDVAHYAGSRYAVAVDSCTNALFLACVFCEVDKGLSVIVPSKTYCSVPQAVIHAGGNVEFADVPWAGVYRLTPYSIVDGAKRFRRGMYEKETLHCLSFHAKKHIPIGKGGMILTDDTDFVKWAKRARYEGREERPYTECKFDFTGWNMYMTPEQAARGLTLMQSLPDDNEDLEEDYPSLTSSKWGIK